MPAWQHGQKCADNGAKVLMWPFACIMISFLHGTGKALYIVCMTVFCAMQGPSSQQFDPFGISDNSPLQAADPEPASRPPPVKFDAFEDDFDEDPNTPLAATGARSSGKLAKVKITAAGPLRCNERLPAMPAS